MLQVLEGIQRVIKKYVINTTPFASSVSSGENEIPVQTSRRYQCGDEIAIYNTEVFNEIGEGEIRIIVDIPDRNTIVLNSPVTDSYPLSTSYTQKLVGGKWIEAVYIGLPGKISHYPAIAISPKTKTNEWFTLESTREAFDIDIYVYALESDFEQSLRIIQHYSKIIETSLFRSLYPLIEPYDEALLAEDVSATDMIIRITDPDMLQCGQSGWIWLESWDYLRYNRVKNYLGNGVYELFNAVSKPFSAGDKVIRPRRHLFNSFPRSIQYGLINTKSALIEGAVISFKAEEEVRRPFPYIDPLTF